MLDKKRGDGRRKTGFEGGGNSEAERNGIGYALRSTAGSNIAVDRFDELDLNGDDRDIAVGTEGVAIRRKSVYIFQFDYWSLLKVLAAAWDQWDLPTVMPAPPFVSPHQAQIQQVLDGSVLSGSGTNTGSSTFGTNGVQEGVGGDGTLDSDSGKEDGESDPRGRRRRHRDGFRREQGRCQCRYMLYDTLYRNICNGRPSVQDFTEKYSSQNVGSM
ncbi:hypothetical protein SCHPADRAFT_927549 [Schizopora paradoxa]|uniref:Uncharacterized protein n=1 Tax=Schizopora paradoxa TaxID=27342 RepID=A0A0H2RSP5_9AGAM|nr:hypothetical protein SCHPADRAFT_927549 [Schizopora paradoxa]